MLNTNTKDQMMLTQVSGPISIKKAFALPDGSAFKYALIGRKKGSAQYEEKLRLVDDAWFQKSLLETTKIYHPSLDTMSNSNYTLVPVDIDDLSLITKNFPGVYRWTAVEELLNSLCPNACQFKSVSSKPKAMYIVEGKLNHAQQISFLKSICPEALFNCLDLKERALRRCFISPSAAIKLGSWLSECPTVCSYTPEVSEIKPVSTIPVEESEHAVKEKKPIWENYSGSFDITLAKSQEDICRFFLGQPYLFLANGIATTITFLCRRFKISSKTAVKSIQDLIAMGLLIRVEGYFPGYKGFTYKPSNELLELATSINASQLGDRVKKAVQSLPEAIEDGNSYEQIKQAAVICGKDSAAFWSWFDNCPGSTLKSRPATAKRVWAGHMAYLNKKI